MTFSEALLSWYNLNKRDLPWRNTSSPYIIWISEIILQQTRVEQGLPYFYKFIENYPTVTDFANASEDEILRLWQGLGYYSRGRNMLKTARVVKEIYGGNFPSSYSELVKLTGIGQYTASAISSFAANEARAVVDGNVYRVLARYFGINEPINSTAGKKIFQQVADEVLNQEHPGLHNQAIMEFGATLCKPKNPACRTCPVRTGCYAFLHQATTALPVKLKTVKVKDRYFNYLLFTDGKTIIMNKRGIGDIWANMYDLPLIETTSLLTVDEVLNLSEIKKILPEDAKPAEIFPIQKHVLTHQRLHIRFLLFVYKPIKLEIEWFSIEVENLKKLALPQIIFIFLTKFFNF